MSISTLKLIRLVTTKNYIFFSKPNSLIKSHRNKGISVLLSPNENLIIIPDIHFNVNLIFVYLLSSYIFDKIILNLFLSCHFWKTVGFLSLLPLNEIILSHIITKEFQIVVIRFSKIIL